jgi:antibiotic biosynthesis monooxygenase (ABM) superfamily enzyme
MTIPVFRVDSFAVPPEAREPFLAMVRATDEVLRQQPGFIRHVILERAEGEGRFNIATVAEWQDMAFIPPARAAVARLHASLPVSPQDFVRIAGIEAHFGLYHPA